MKVETPQLLWHPEAEKGLPAALMSLDILESGVSSSSVKSHVLATCGNSSDVHLWKVELEQEQKQQSSSFLSAVSKIDFLTNLTRHDGPVNVCKFSPDGLHLVTAGDSGAVVIYSVPLEKRGNSNGKHFWWYLTKENELTMRIVTRHGDGVTDASWSYDSQRLMVSTIDHAVLILEANANNDWKVIYRNSSNHSHYVQGVAYDPLHVYLASAAADRSVRILTRKQPSKCKKGAKQQQQQQQVLTNKIQNDNNNNAAALAEQLPPQTANLTTTTTNPDAMIQQVLSNSKLELNIKAKLIKYRKNEETNSSSSSENNNKHYWFADECNLESFVRRLAWTPDGAFLIVPAGQTEDTYATIVFKRHQFDHPHRILGGLEKVRVIRTCELPCGREGLICSKKIIFHLLTHSLENATISFC
jgi:chromatin assembly factor 1 subunit B